ncbi:glutamyl-Q tRNA(Asp) synthetase [Alishewanella longhuensis]|uniref:Glutamyl-Q tRNA(Asp) synthetase n=1 Tax=Alishewanella longhuensis TaxID=1091037 RepID=A0ABQ3L0S1_9ALTE|nr:tRNA glutamyl-Q(34) synthetase GluQRS [Alishewanella longhuensis]GHG65523.1 glutamyl-Q tRNA(Asp) synthetase [Alishewanella longhuensis]
MSNALPLQTASYIGRFAPSPSGPLHFGSLIAAVGSYLQAKSQQGKWLLRIEDIDTPRVQAGADSAIMRTLEAFGLHWDDAVIYQSQRLARYQQVFQDLQQRHLLYGCQCTRREISLAGGSYPATCANLKLSQEPLAWRLKANGVSTAFTDLIFGNQQIDSTLAREDYIVKRRDGLFSYQLVVVIDDLDQQITEVIRGADLLSMTPRQQHLFALLGQAAPRYGHLPLAVSSPGHKLSKQNHASALDQWPLQHSLAAALQLLGHPVPQALSAAPVTEILAWAVQHWQLAKVPVTTEIHCSTFA